MWQNQIDNSRLLIIVTYLDVLEEDVLEESYHDSDDEESYHDVPSSQHLGKIWDVVV